MTRPAPPVITGADYCATGWPARPGQDDRSLQFEACVVVVQRRLGGRAPCGQPATWRVRTAGRQTGSTGHYCDELGHDVGRGWWCSCAARSDRCCHLDALPWVTTRVPRLHLAASRRTA
jgi:hypothetical protein